MKAVVFTSQGEVLRDVPEPIPNANEVLISVEYCGICGSDLHAAEPDFHDSVIMGHEFAGTIVGIGRDIDDWAIGQRVSVNPNGDWCGQCDACRAGSPNMCPHIWETAVGLARDGGLARLASVRARNLHLLPDEVSTKQGAWVEPLAVALRTVRRSGLRVGDDAIVFGGGPIGLLVTSVLRRAGAGTITLVELSEERRRIGRVMGASQVIDPAAQDLEKLFPDRFAAPSIAFECTGVAEVTRQAVSMLRPHGRLMVTGFSRTDPMFRAADLLWKEIEIRGSFIYVAEYEAAIGVLARGEVDIDQLTTATVPVESAVDAFAAMRSSTSAVKFLIGAGP
jgi:threonine dehydrogenase-like Zn-dependent dehydrogenase